MKRAICSQLVKSKQALKGENIPRIALSLRHEQLLAFIGISERVQGFSGRECSVQSPVGGAFYFFLGDDYSVFGIAL